MPSHFGFPMFMLAILVLAGCGRGLQVTDLKCEYRSDPVGLDVRRPRFSWSSQSNQRSCKQTAYQLIVSTSLSRCRKNEGDLWDSGKIEGDQPVPIVYEGALLGSRVDAWWKVRVWTGSRASSWSAPARFSLGLLSREDWQAQWIGVHDGPASPPAGEKTEAHKNGTIRQPLPAALLRKEFSLSGKPAEARLYATARGVYDVTVNGRRLGGGFLAPEWTDYDSRLQVQAWDAAELLREGGNAIGITLAEGWYAGRLGWQSWPDVYGKYPTFLLQLEIRFQDGSGQTLVTDGSWRGTLDGPVLRAGLYDGETVDARKEMKGWNTAGFDDSGWQPVTREPMDSVRLVWQRSQPVTAFQEIKPVKVVTSDSGTVIYDLGQNLVGWCRLQVRGPAGSEIRLRHAEVLNPDGTFYTANLRGARAEDIFILSGNGTETFEPRFTYHGFRYVEASGFSKQVKPISLTGIAVGTDAPVCGSFECSNPLVNQLMKNILWGQRGNMIGIPTDCPQRDERLGWMGDTQAFAQTAIFNMDMAAFLAKFVQDIRDAQLPDGRYPDFAPRGPVRRSHDFAGAPAWGDAGVIIPWRLYVNYGDKRILEEHFASVQAWIEYIRSNNPDLLWKNARGNDYGDWVNGNTVKIAGFPETGNEVPKDVFATSYFANSVRLASKMASALGMEPTAREYRHLFDLIRDAFNRAYVDEDGRIAGDTQAGYALALYFDLLKNSRKAGALQRLLNRIEDYHGHLSTGIHTTPMAMMVLSANGRHDKACELISLTDPPSWGYMISQGATTLWERWDGAIAGRGFADPGMNSFNHFMFGAVGEWVWRMIVGLNPDETAPGYQHVVISPRPGPSFTWARGTYASIRGPISICWKTEEDTFSLDITLPPNTRATVMLPAKREGLLESGRPVDEVRDISFESQTEEGCVLLVGSGSYHFSASALQSYP